MNGIKLSVIENTKINLSKLEGDVFKINTYVIVNKKEKSNATITLTRSTHVVNIGVKGQCMVAIQGSEFIIEEEYNSIKRIIELL